jgi:hypothetical protein
MVQVCGAELLRKRFEAVKAFEWEGEGACSDAFEFIFVTGE